MRKDLRDEEIKACFRDNPDLINKSPYQLALFFFIQGELSSSHLREKANQRANYFRHKLGVLDKESLVECDKKWNEE